MIDPQAVAKALWDQLLPTDPNAQEILERTVREVWNARGDADRERLAVVLLATMGRTKAARYLVSIDHALRQLDR